MRRIPLVSNLAGIACLVVACAAWADATVTLCDIDDEIGPVPHGPPVNLTSALNTGGMVTFDCPPGKVLQVTHTHVINKPTTIDGRSSNITLKMVTTGDAALIFDSGQGLTVKNLTMMGHGDGIALYTLSAPLFLSNVTIREFRVGVASSASLLNIADGSQFLSLGWGVVSHSNTVANISSALFQTIRFSPIRFFGGPLVVDGTTIESSGQSTFESESSLSCSVNISHSHFEKNSVTGGEGGAMLIGCDTTVAYTDFRQNSASNGGGAVKIVDGATNVSFRMAKFIENTSGLSGGAISVAHFGASNLKLQLQYVSFVRNQATNGGGAIYFLGTPATRLLGAELLFDGNTARGGGAIWWPVGVVDIDRGIFVRNKAQVLGGGVVHYGAFGPSALSNCLFVHNEAIGGAAVHGRGMRLINCTVAENTGSAILGANGPGSTTPGPPSNLTIGIVNSIVVGNSGGNCAMRDGVVVADQGHNLQFPDASCKASIPVADPKLDSFYVPAYFSPAFQAGDNGVCTSVPVRSKDVYGQPRPQGKVCTIGAVEGELTPVLYQRRFRDIRRPPWWSWDALFGKSCCR